MSTMIPDWFRDGFNLLVVSIILVIYIATEITCYFPSSLIGVINQEEKAAAVTNECNALPLGGRTNPLSGGGERGCGRILKASFSLLSNSDRAY